MKTSIEIVSISGTLREQLEAIAPAGFPAPAAPEGVFFARPAALMSDKSNSA